jgi:uncharacterized protein YjbI with pentapeptide repeats
LPIFAYNVPNYSVLRQPGGNLVKSAAIALLALAIIVPSSSTLGAITPLLNYQGYLVDSLGYPYPDGTHNITFSIYSEAENGTPLWTETQSVALEKGLLHAYLGSVVPFGDDLFKTHPLYLGITYETNPEFSPRVQLAASVYSFLAANSDRLDGYPAEHFIDSTVMTEAIGDHSANPSAHHTKTTDASELTSGTLDPARLPEISVDSNDIVDGSVTSADLADASVISSKIANDAVGSDQLDDDAVSNSKVVNGTLTGAKLADSTITGDKIAAGAISSEHLSSTSFTGDNIADGSLTAVDLADSTITGDKIAAGAISAEHLSGVSLTGANIADGSLTGADIQDGTIYGIDIGYNDVTSYNIKDGTITGDDIASGTISGIKIIDGSIGNADMGYNSVGTAQLVDNSVRSVDVNNNSLESVDILDEPGVDDGYGYVIASVDTSIHNWVTVTINAPADGYVLVIFTCIAQITSGEIAEAGVSLDPNQFGSYGEAKIISTAAGTGANMTITTSDILPVSAGNVVIYGNVRASLSSSGNVDFREGKLQALFITTRY